MFHPLRAARAVRAIATLLANPSRLDQVFGLLDAAHDPEYARGVVARLKGHPRAARAFAERRRLGTLDLLRLGACPVDSLGWTYAEHMRKNGLDAKAIPSLVAVDETRYLRAHLYETHDIWHAVTGFGADVVGELGLQAFYVAQMRGRVSTSLVGGGIIQATLRKNEDIDARMDAIVRGWTMGRAAQPLFGVPWQELWDVPLSTVRAELGVVTG